MQSQCVIAEYHSVDRARVGLEVLGKMRLGPEHVSVVRRGDEEELQHLAELQEDEAQNMSVASTTSLGGLLGGALAAPVAASTLIGPFILVGPLVGVGLGAAVGRLLAGAQNWGVNEDAAAEYERKVEEGAILLIVIGDEIELRESKAALKTTGPESLAQFAYAETDPKHQ